MDNQCRISYQIAEDTVPNKIIAFDEDEQTAVEKAFDKLRSLILEQEVGADNGGFDVGVLSQFRDEGVLFCSTQDDCQIPKPYNQAYILSQMC